MKENCFALLLFLVSLSALAQVKGVVKDSLSGKPVAFVSISVENENLGTTSEENGEFIIRVSEKSKKLIFNALGYERKMVSIANVSEVSLSPKSYPLEELVISKRRETREREIGQTDNQISEAFDNGPRVDTKFFPYLPSYKKTKFLKQVVIVTDSKIDDATFKIHFYNVDANGYPGEELLDKDFIVSVSRGVKRTRFNLTRFNLIMPKEGLFVGFEKLMIAKNKDQVKESYYPFILYNNVERDFLITLSGGKWRKDVSQNRDNPEQKMRIYEPAINLILTN